MLNTSFLSTMYITSYLLNFMGYIGEKPHPFFNLMQSSISVFLHVLQSAMINSLHASAVSFFFLTF